VGGIFMMEDVKILRKLAYEYTQIANSDRNAENIKLHKAVNDLRQIRPVVLLDELPWNEMNINNELTLQCTDEYLRTVEWFLRTSIFRNKYFPADMVVPGYIPVRKVINSTGIGITIDEDILHTDKDNNIVSHMYKDVLQTEEDFEKIHNPVITYDKEETLRRYNMVGEIFGDILPVRLTGINVFYMSPWDDIARYRGVTNMLIDLIDRPEFMHKIAKKLFETELSRLEEYEELGLLDENPISLHGTAAHTDDLPSKDFNGEKATRKDIWGRGMAQIFAHVSKEMHYEFDISYMIQTLGQFGLVYYGCCEPLDKRIDIVSKIPNLRKISISTWADVNIAAEAIGTKYVMSVKPNPSAVAVSQLDKETLKKEIENILDACRKNNCSCDIVLKDISTCCKHPENIFEWEKVVMDIVRNY